MLFAPFSRKSQTPTAGAKWQSFLVSAIPESQAKAKWSKSQELSEAAAAAAVQPADACQGSEEGRSTEHMTGP